MPQPRRELLKLHLEPDFPKVPSTKEMILVGEGSCVTAFFPWNSDSEQGHPPGAELGVLRRDAGSGRVENTVLLPKCLHILMQAIRLTIRLQVRNVLRGSPSSLIHTIRH